jgi:hypothetical protein
MKASLVAYDGRQLHKKSKLKIIKYGYFRGYPKCLATQIGLLKILGVKFPHPSPNGKSVWINFP